MRRLFRREMEMSIRAPWVAGISSMHARLIEAYKGPIPNLFGRLPTQAPSLDKESDSLIFGVWWDIPFGLRVATSPPFHPEPIAK